MLTREQRIKNLSPPEIGELVRIDLDYSWAFPLQRDAKSKDGLLDLNAQKRLIDQEYIIYEYSLSQKGEIKGFDIVCVSDPSLRCLSIPRKAIIRF